MNNRSRQRVRAMRLMYPYGSAYERHFYEAVQSPRHYVAVAAKNIMESLANAVVVMSEAVHEWVTSEAVQEKLAELKAQVGRSDGYNIEYSMIDEILKQKPTDQYEVNNDE